MVVYFKICILLETDGCKKVWRGRGGMVLKDFNIKLWGESLEGDLKWVGGVLQQV